MAVEVYFREQIGNILNATAQAGGGTANLVVNEMARLGGGGLAALELADHLRIYRQGYGDALKAVAAALGIADRLQLNTAETGEPLFINVQANVASRAWQEA